MENNSIYHNIQITGDEIQGYTDTMEKCGYRFLRGNHFTSISEMTMAVYSVVKNRMYNEYANIDRNDNSERIIIFGLNGLLKDYYSGNKRVHFFQQKITKNDVIPYSEFAIFAIFSNNDFKVMDDVINNYINSRKFVEFEDYHRDNPWLRLIAIK